MNQDTISAVRDTVAHAGHVLANGAHPHHHHPPLYIPIIIGVSLFLLVTFGLSFWAQKKPKMARMLKRIRTILQIMLGIMMTTLIILTIIGRAFGHEYGRNIIEQSHRLTLICLVILITVIIDAIIVNFFERRMVGENENPHDNISFNYVSKLVSFCIYALGFAIALMVFPKLNAYGQKILAGAGIFAIGLSFIAKESLANIVSGLLIIIFKPFKIGDIIKIGDTDDEELVGHVNDITLRHTIIRNFKNKMVVVPNSMMNSDRILNYDIGQKETCAWVVIGISYDSDIDLARRIMTDEIKRHPNFVDVRTPQDIMDGKPEVLVRVIDLADSAVVLRAWAWGPNYLASFAMKCDLYESIKKRFDREGIEIPFPQQVTWLKNKDEDVRISMKNLGI